MEQNYQEPKLENQPNKSSSYLVPVSIVIAGAMIAGSLFFSLGRAGTGAPDKPSQGAAGVLLGETIEVNLGSNPVLGEENTQITIIEFSDYQCPFCERFFSQTEPQILEKYVKTGLAKFAYRDFAFLDGFVGQDRGESHLAAEAARCAGDQGQYWQYHDTLFQNQDGENTGAFSVDNLKKFASRLNLDADDFAECLDDGKYQNIVVQDTNEGGASGVSGTPTVFIGKGKLVVDPQLIRLQAQAGENVIQMDNGTIVIIGALPFAAFESIIDNILQEL